MAEVRAGPPDGRRLLPDASRDLAHHLVPAARYRAWVALGPDPWVVSTMTRGHRLQFARTPALTRSWVVTSVADPHHRVVLRAEVSTLLAKKAIRVVGPEDQRAGFYSRYFLIPKKDGGLRGLNQFLRPLKFKMLTIHRVR